MNYLTTIKAKAPTIGLSGNSGGVEHIFDVETIDDIPNRLKEEIEFYKSFYKSIEFAITNISIKVDNTD